MYYEIFKRAGMYLLSNFWIVVKILGAEDQK